LAKLVEPQREIEPIPNSSEVATAIMPPPSIPGMIMGTAGYMSPEQAQGRINEIDHRSDIFSFGCLLFEAATGRRAFDGRDALDSLHKIVYEPTPQLRELIPLAPRHLQDITDRCLAKEPDRRYQSITEVATELNALQRELTSSGVEYSRGAATAPHDAPTTFTPQWTKNEFTITRTRQLNPIGLAVIGIGIVAVLAAIAFIVYRSRSSSAAIQSIAVMPFVNDSGNADVEYLSDGMTETLISSLSSLPNLNIKPRSDVFRYKGTETSPQKIGKELNVQAILNGRVVQRGQDVSLYVELIDVALDKVVWSQQYNRKQTDLIALQTDIARDVLSGLKIKLTSANEAKVTKTYTTNPEAYQFYLKGKYYADKFTKEGFRQSIDNFNQAIALDRNYSSAYSGLAYAYILLDDWFESPRQSAPQARDMAQKALAIDETDVDAHVVLGMVAHWYDWDWAAAEREFKRSLELNPRNTDSYTYYAFFLASMKRPDEARAVALQGLELDPLSSGMNFTLGSTLVFNHRWDEAIAHFQNAIELDPNYWFHHSYLGRSYEQKGMMPQAIVEFKKALELDDSQSENWAGLGHAYAVSGNKAEAEKMIAEMIKRSSQNIYVAPYNVAVIYAGLGDKDKTFEWLERAYSDRAYYLPVYLITDARMDSLHNDPRFTDLLRRMNLPQ